MTSTVGKDRRLAREIALAFLYQWDMRGAEVLAEMDDLLLRDRRSPEVSEYTKALVNGTIAHKDDLDRLISAAADNWRIERMAVVDRNVLRMAIWEMDVQRADVPPKVAINEAIELAKRFSTEQSGAFVNGILDRVKRSLAL
ncbi:MAG: transcription antitermination factor NusB [Planctomycetes bacterium]|nr:transcription antitermination factor NusB [Planctomycetota bacterium]